MKKLLLVIALGVACACAGKAARMIITPLPSLDPELVNFVIIIGEPREGVEQEFYESYGLLFQHDARADGPICVERRVDLKTGAVLQKRCITLEELRQWMWQR